MNYSGWLEGDFIDELNNCVEQNDEHKFIELCDYIKQHYHDIFEYIIDLRKNNKLPHNPIMKWTDKYLDIINFYNKMD